MRTTLSYRTLFNHQNFLHKLRLVSYKNGLVFFLSLLILPAQAAKQVLPDFSTAPIGPHATYFRPSFSGTAALYVGASSASVNNEYALAASNNGADFTPLAPAQVTLNNQANATNPINGAKVNLIGLANNLPAVVLDGQKKIYFTYRLTYAPKDVSVLSSTDLNDSTGAVTDGVVKLAGGNLTGTNYLFAAVKSNTGGSTFGATGSGIATLKQTNTTNGQQVSTALTILNNNLATALTGSTAQVYINNAATIASNLVDLYWNSNLNCLYIAISASTAAAANSGARAVIVGKVVANQLQFTAIAPDAVFTDNTGIVGTNLGASVSSLDISIQKLTGMSTSTCLNYLVVAGGNGSATTTGNLIYALPIVNSSDSNNGTLAKYDSDPTVTTTGGFFQTRAYTVPATAAGDILTNSSTAAIVGGGALPMSASSQITDLFTIDDTVFASIGDSYSITSTPGLFCSQALFDNLGRIQKWTPWQRAGGTDAPMLGAGPIPNSGDFWYIPNNTTVQKTTWGAGTEDGLLGGTTSDASVGLINNIDWQVQGLNNYTPNSAVLDNGLANFSMIIATGYQVVSLIATGQVTSGFYKPNFGDFATGAQTNYGGTVPALSSNCRLVTIANGDLAKLGPITTSVIATKTATPNQHWIIVGGSNGIAVLCDGSGVGWTGDLTQLSDLPAGLTFKQVGNYQFVQKLISDGTYLYILTNGKLDKILLSSTNFATNNLNPSTLIETGINSDNSISFSDLVISSKLALLATSKGLLRTGNGADIRTATSTSDVNWTTVTIPQAIGPVYQISPLSPTANLQDFANGGNLYLLSAYRGYLQATVNRFTVNLGSNVDDNTIQPLPDQYLANQLSTFINFYDFKDAFNYLSGAMYVAHSLDNSSPLTLQKMPNDLKSNSRFFNYKSDIYTESLNPGITPTQINPTMISSASGALLTSGNFGLRVDE
ncbi:MAG TPA: hypothetical protein VJJ81_01740 [Candidatus Babeliales bacterium]|nr:hypothetical protein [Candidatus Babeliales bacterium]